MPQYKKLANTSKMYLNNNNNLSFSLIDSFDFYNLEKADTFTLV